MLKKEVNIGGNATTISERAPQRVYDGSQPTSFPAKFGAQPTAETNGAQPTVKTNCSQLTVETTPPGKKRVCECLSEDTPKKGYRQPSKFKGVRATNRNEIYAKQNKYYDKIHKLICNKMKAFYGA